MGRFPVLTDEGFQQVDESRGFSQVHALTTILHFYCTYKSTISLLQPLMDSVTVSARATRQLSCSRVMRVMPEGQVPALKLYRSWDCAN